MSVLSSYPEHLQQKLLTSLDYRPPLPSGASPPNIKNRKSWRAYYAPTSTDPRFTLKSPSPNPPTNSSLIPPILFQTDAREPSAADQQSWLANGFERNFFDDASAAEWVEEHFGNSEVARTYAELPLPILKADLLRYLLLLVNGGVYSDVDTRALMPISKWAADAISWPIPTFQSPDYDPRQPLPPPRIIVGIEGGALAWRDLGNLIDLTGFKRGPRHRFFQFVQWTIASAPAHPILIDTIRRVIETSVVASAWNITHTRRVEALRAAALGLSGSSEQLEPLVHSTSTSSDLDIALPDDSMLGPNFRARFRGREGRMRAWKMLREEETRKKPWEEDTLGERLCVQEWTGPAAFTDSVLSYLLAVAGVKQEDLYAIDRPVQVADVVILPMDGFNPIPHQLPRPHARVVHLFRGSWKADWKGMHEWDGVPSDEHMRDEHVYDE